MHISATLREAWWLHYAELALIAACVKCSYGLHSMYMHLHVLLDHSTNLFIRLIVDNIEL